MKIIKTIALIITALILVLLGFLFFSLGWFVMDTSTIQSMIFAIVAVIFSLGAIKLFEISLGEDSDEEHNKQC